MEQITVKEIESSFEKDYSHLFEMGAERVSVIWRSPEDIGEDARANLPEYMTESTEIDPNIHGMHIRVPVIFDHRKIPKLYKGLKVRTVVITDKPPHREWDFGDREIISYEESANPRKYIDFVNRCAVEIRLQLKNPNMTFEEMLDAICWGDFEKYKAEYEQAIYSYYENRN